jgi:hypothetical protein
MRIETIRAWMLVGFCLLMIGTLLYIFDVTDGAMLSAIDAYLQVDGPSMRPDYIAHPMLFGKAVRVLSGI